MGKVNRGVYQPIEENARAYDALYAEYVRLHDWFGRGGNDVMHRLRAIRRGAMTARTVAQGSVTAPGGSAADAAMTEGGVR